MKTTRKKLFVLFSGILLVCILAAAASALSNQSLPGPPDALDRLSELDKARLGETFRLKRTFGEEVWPGWGRRTSR